MKNISALPWPEIHDSVSTNGYALISQFLSGDECDDMIARYPDSTLYRSVISMERFRFGAGEYKYYKYPLPHSIQHLRQTLYEKLAPLANHWNEVLGDNARYPLAHADFLQVCHQAEQLRPTPLILHYNAGGYNTLHQDLYGDVYFPFQVVFVLTQHGEQHKGGELVFTEQVPRAQSKAEVISPNRGDAVIFTTNYRPVKGTRGYYKTKMKHGVSRIREGKRYALGIIFHDAK